MMEYYEIWWELVTGAKRFAEAIARNISLGISTVVCIPDSAPWRGELSETIIRNLIDQDNWYEPIDWNAHSAIDNAGLFLLESINDKKAKAEFAYCSHNTTIEQFLTNRRLLENKVFWIKNVSSDGFVAWKSFLKKSSFTPEHHAPITRRSQISTPPEMSSASPEAAALLS